jgi:eukaryotic-like serine/threonine-protein kinase
MASAQEKRFARLVLAKKTLTREQLKSCQEFQKAKEATGSRLPLWDCAVLQDMLDQNLAEKLQDAAGDLTVESLGGFAIVRKIGEGGMGSVWLASGPDKQKVAVKLLPAHLAKKRTYLTRFFREAQTCMKLDHKNIVRGVAVAEDHGYYYFAMEYVVGSSVADMIKKSGALPPDEATSIVLQVCEGLAHAHEHGIIHRDIKPDNIMVTRAGVAKLMDLGIARQEEEGADLTALTQTGAAMGTPYYMAPEQSQDSKRADARSDVYSLGATWYHMVTGQVPFDGDSPLQVMHKHLREPLHAPHIVKPGIPRGVSIVIEHMMVKEPERRTQSALEAAALIRERCMGERDVAKELGIQKDDVGDLWEMQIQVGQKRAIRRMSMDEVRQRAQRGQIDKKTPTRRAGEHAEFQPAQDFVELSRELFRDYAVRAGARRDDAPPSRRRMHDLVSNYDEAERAHKRKRAWKKWKPRLIKVAAVAVLAAVAFAFWPQISGMVSDITNEGAANAPDNAL